MPTPEELARINIDHQLAACGWIVQSRVEMNLYAGRGVAVRGAGTRRVLTDLVSLVRHAVQLDDELVPYPERVQRRYADWLAAQQTEGRVFTPEQRWWLDQVATHIGVNLEIHAEDFNYGEFFNRGGQVAALRTFGTKLNELLDELNERLNNA